MSTRSILTNFQIFLIPNIAGNIRQMLPNDGSITFFPTGSSYQAAAMTCASQSTTK